MKLRKLKGPALVLTILLALWVVVLAILLFARPSFFSASTLTTILQFSTILMLVSMGQAIVILSGGACIDLSVAGNVSLTAVCAMLLAKAGMPFTLVPVVCIVIGLALGALNGVIVTRLSLPPLIVTLATLFVYSGLALAVTGGAAQSGVPAWLTGWGRGLVGAFPMPFITLALPVVIVIAALLSLTSWGRWIYAMGFNDRSARLVGIPVEKTRLILYMVSGMLAGLAALVSLAWLGSARPNIGQNLELDSLTAAMLGGIAITGGRGGVLGVAAAVILIVTLKTGLLQMNVNTVWQIGIVGALLIAVLLAERLSERWS